MSTVSSTSTPKPTHSYFQSLYEFFDSPKTQSFMNVLALGSVAVSARINHMTTHRFGKNLAYAVSTTSTAGLLFKNIYLDKKKQEGALAQHTKMIHVWKECVTKIKAEIISPAEEANLSSYTTDTAPSDTLQMTPGGENIHAKFLKNVIECQKLLGEIEKGFSSVEFQNGTDYSAKWEMFAKKFKSLMSHHDEFITDMKNQRADLTTERNNLIAERDTFKDQYTTAKDDRDNLSIEVQEGIEARAHLEADLRAVRKSERTLRLQMADVVKAKAKLEEQSKATIANLREELKAATTSKGEVKRELDESRMKLEEQSILLKSLDAQIKQQQKQIEILEEQNRLLQSVNKSFGEKFAKLEADNVALKADNAELKADNAALKADNVKMAENFTKLQTTFEQFRKEVMGDLLKKMDADKKSKSSSVNQNP